MEELGVCGFKHPSILFLEGCFLRDCSSIEDIFDQGLLAQTESGNTAVVYDRIKRVFTGIDMWEKNNILCWHCGLDFDTIPIFIPTFIDTIPLLSIGVYGNFCSWGCARSVIDTDFRSTKWERVEMLKVLHEIFTGEKIKDIKGAPAKTKMKRYGGTMTEFEYKSIVRSLIKSHETALSHNAVKHISVSRPIV